jgi:hypothetical protein
MTWIKTPDGKLLNLERITAIQVIKVTKNDYQVRASESFVTYYDLLDKPVPQEKAEGLLQVLENTLGAQSLEDLVENEGRGQGQQRDDLR